MNSGEKSWQKQYKWQQAKKRPVSDGRATEGENEMTYTTHWSVNDGKNGYPNILADTDWTEVNCRSYEEAIKEHAKVKGVKKLLSISEKTGKGSRGKMNGRSYRDFTVEYLSNDGSETTVSKEIRVFGSYSGKSKTL